MALRFKKINKNDRQPKAKQSKVLKKRYTFKNIVFSDKTCFTLVCFIEKNLTPLYKNEKDKTIKEKNSSFRNNEENYITILARLDYFLHNLKRHASKYGGFIILQHRYFSFEKYFPNITNLFYERYRLRQTVYNIEEGNLDDEESGVSSLDLCLYDFAKELYYSGLSAADISHDLHKYSSDYDSDEEVYFY